MIKTPMIRSIIQLAVGLLSVGALAAFVFVGRFGDDGQLHFWWLDSGPSRTNGNGRSIRRSRSDRDVEAPCTWTQLMDAVQAF